MNKRLAEIAERKRALVERASQERADLAAAYRKIRSPIQFSGIVLTLGRALKSYPLFAAGASSFLVSGFAGKLFRSGKKLLGLWKFTRPVRHWWNKRRRLR